MHSINEDQPKNFNDYIHIDSQIAKTLENKGINSFLDILD
jgi:hypothetical protein